MRVLVTGGAGFIGANLCRTLTTRPEVESLTVLDDLSSGDPANLADVGADLVIGSILDRDLLAELVPRATHVIHLAARPSVPRSVKDPLASHAVNATGTLHVLEACRATRPHVTLASSSSVYGDCAEPFKHEDLPARPLSPYGASKLATEAYALAYAASYGLPVLPFRFFNVYGPLQPAGHAYAAVIPAFVSAALAGRPVPIHGDGRQARDFTYVGSVADVLADAAVREVTSATPVNLAFGTRVSLLDLKDALAAVLGRRVEAEFLPPRAGDIRESQASARLLLDRFPGVLPLPLEEGLRLTVTWFEKTSGVADA
ncbi:NAD-dependent epimerase/dehydratase family protein [Microbispora bryophytorum]|uniref:UDP-glucose 4-epimerase-like protein n=1 Tax=Microbispora bryophytorum TaxID=1460882 RepID=A0A8H9LD99_9ACTN|nr:NAD-dependent epimerase/dehydratase family protein [Microbispora bryophytorum]MBD3139465.1 NAD-dependent epimerase/dehydratase family protein [Microbispora bryophytorum]TQS04473.1 NAD-dependent epimerase/dehydratase family protein [Microbispora bryophytorum]GGO23637.1 UDP-glucose 4-epimerase-like protein [Microbispora bryophytorum]